MKTGIVVIFPGARYTCQKDLLVKCAEKYEMAGYQVIKLSYHQVPFQELNTYEEVITHCTPLILAQLHDIDFHTYSNIVFISKSVGTVLACYFADYFSITPKHLFLTPEQETLTRIHPSFHIMGLVIGDEDPYINYEEVVHFATANHFPFLVVHGVAHNLKPKNVDTANPDNHILALCEV